MHLEKDEPAYLNSLGEELFQKGDSAGAEEVFLKALKESTNRAAVHNNLSVLYWSRGDVLKAVEHSMHALTLSPLDRAVVLNAGEIFRSLEQFEQACAVYSHYLSHCSGDDEVDARFRETSIMMKNYKERDTLEEGLRALFSILASGKKVVFSKLYSERLGHLATLNDIFLRKQQLGKIPPDTLYIYLSGPPANRQLMEMLKRHMNIIENEQLLKFFGSFKGLKTACQVLPRTGNEIDEFRNANATLKFTEEEEEKGRNFLKDVGISKNDWFVCISARDHAYLRDRYPTADLEYHSYRNSDINTYRKAIDHIIGLGGFVIRMGFKVDGPLNYEHPRVIDYALKYRNDFMDIYLAAKCKFCLGTPSGIWDVSPIFDVPSLAVNNAPIGTPVLAKRVLYIPKKVRYRDTGEYVPFRNLLCEFKDRMHPATYRGTIHYEMGYVYEDNTEDEIYDVTVEMMERLNGTFCETDEDRELLERYYALFPPDHFAKDVRSPIGLDFLKKNRHLFFESERMQGSTETDLKNSV
jgi:putative glycosyltransferase (TIGR04372 family)